MEGMPYSGKDKDRPGMEASLWTQFTTAVRNLLGLADKNQDLLEQILEATAPFIVTEPNKISDLKSLIKRYLDLKETSSTKQKNSR